MSQTESEPLVAVLSSLPTDPLERQLILDEFEYHPDERFANEVLGALAQFRRDPNNVHETRERFGKDWRGLVDHSDVFSRKDQDRLDEFQQLLPATDDTFMHWIERAGEMGLVEAGDVQHFQNTYHR